jgi:hypothetical protein|tara:strand:+ start:323 stop:532 length:210 start_codon:yes stop_codon:yes gene_type:complete
MKKQLLEALISHAKGQIAKHKTNVDVYMNSTIGIGEHSDIVETLEKEIDHIAKYEDQLEIINKYFKENE